MKKLLFLLTIIQNLAFSQNWKMANTPLSTEWAGKVNPQNPLPEYPRPMMVRDKWLNLNGLWEFQEGQSFAFNKKLDGQILVPYPWESALSGVRKQFDSRRATYRRTFSVPNDWKGQHILLHFGAVDWEATVYVNGKSVGTHRGGYDAFSYDITPFLTEKGNQELIVSVFDPGNDEAIAVGKQENSRFTNPQRYSYCPSSGIWQTVWLEPVPKVSIKDVHITPDIDNEEITVTVNPSQQMSTRWKAEIIAFDGTTEVGRTTADLNKPTPLSILKPKLWSPDNPFLYDVKIILKLDVPVFFKSRILA